MLFVACTHRGRVFALCSPPTARRQGEMRTAERKAMCDRFHRDPDRVRKEEFVHQPPGGETVRATVEYVNGEVRVHVVHRSLLAGLLGGLNPVES